MAFDNLRLVSVTRIARMLNISGDTVRRLIQKGEMAAYKIGGQYQVDRAELRRFVKSRRFVARDLGEGKEGKGGV